MTKKPALSTTRRKQMAALGHKWLPQSEIDEVMYSLQVDEAALITSGVLWRVYGPSKWRSSLLAYGNEHNGLQFEVDSVDNGMRVRRVA